MRYRALNLMHMTAMWPNFCVCDSHSLSHATTNSFCLFHFSLVLSCKFISRKDAWSANSSKKFQVQWKAQKFLSGVDNHPSKKFPADILQKKTFHRLIWGASREKHSMFFFFRVSSQNLYKLIESTTQVNESGRNFSLIIFSTFLMVRKNFFDFLFMIFHVHSRAFAHKLIFSHSFDNFWAQGEMNGFSTKKCEKGLSRSTWEDSPRNWNLLYDACSLGEI